MRHTTASGAAARIAARTLVLIAALIAALLISTLAGLTATARAGTTTAPLKAVVILGPFGELQTMGRNSADAIANAAEANGMTVSRLFHPNATWASVVDAAQGANLLVYIGHGNGWPSPYAPFQENTKDGFGLNFADPTKRSAYDVKYYGANKIREQIRLADNAIVMFNHLCYAAGYGEQWMSPPSESVAVQRVDNYAAGFLAIGARAVFALEYDYLAKTVGWLFSQHTSMEGVFRKTWGQGGTKTPYYGWVGWDPRYFDSVRMPGNRMLLDPHPTDSYRRAITGDLAFTTDEWRGAGDPSDVVAPEVTSLSGIPSSNTVPANEDAAPVFTPNGDGLSDVMNITHTVSEPAYLDFEIRDSSDAVVRRFTTWSDAGDGSSVWNGKNDAGGWVAEGRYDIFVTPKDLAGNLGLTVSTRVKVLKAMKSPASTPAHFNASDGDALAASTTLSVTMTRDAALDWRVQDSVGNVVQTFMDQQAVASGVLNVVWDGRDAAGDYVPDGMYTQVLTATTENGSYSHFLGLRVMPYKITAPTWTGTAGTKVTFTMVSAEPLKGYPQLYVKQPGLTQYRGYTIKLSKKKFKWTITFKSGGQPGQVRLKFVGTDTGGQTQTTILYFTLE